MKLQLIYSFWSEDNPRWVGQKNQLKYEQVMVWAGIIDTTIIGPYFFDANVSGDTYLECLVDYVLPELHRKGFDSMQICYMHDGAPGHIPPEVRQCLDDNFSSWIGRFDGERNLLAWPPRSPDLNPLDFFLWGYLQHRVQLNEDETLEELRHTITAEIEEVPPHMLENVQPNMKKRLRKCIQENGGLFEHLLK